jgi:hypothetical protein
LLWLLRFVSRLALADVHSGDVLILPDMTDASGATRHLAVGAGKDQHIYLVDRDNLGKFSSTANNNYQDLSGVLAGQVFSKPAYFNGRLYYGSVSDSIKAFQFSNARLETPPVAATASSFPYPGATPSISANGAANGIVWAAENSSTAVLHAYDAGTLSELYNSNMASKIVPDLDTHIFDHRYPPDFPQVWNRSTI